MLRDSSDHILLLTATPHKGDPENFPLFPQLLDRDAYADVRSIRQAIDAGRAPFYLWRTKEAMVYFPERDPDGRWEARKIFTKRIPTTALAVQAEDVERAGVEATVSRWPRTGTASCGPAAGGARSCDSSRRSRSRASSE